VETTASPASPAARVEAVAVPLAGVAAAVAFVAVGLDRSFWVDEAFSALLATRDVRGVIDGLRQDGNFPAYFLALSAWSRLAGESEIALRLPSVLFYLAGIAATGLLGATAFDDRRVGAWSAFFYLASDLAVQHAQNARPYALLGLLVAVSHLLYLRSFFRDESSWRWRAAFGVVTALGALTHVCYLFVIGAQAVGLALSGSRRRVVEGVLLLAAGLLPFCVLWLPAFLGQIANGNATWIPPLRVTLWRLPTDFYHPVVSVVLAFGIVAVAMAARRRAADLLRGSPLGALALLATVPLIPPLVISTVQPIYVPDRYAMAALPAVAVVLGAVFSRLTGELVRVAIAAVALGLTVHAHVAARSDVLHFADIAPGHSDRRASTYLLEHARPGDVLCFTSLSRVTIDYYLRRRGASTRFVERTFPSEIDAHPCFRIVHRDRFTFPEYDAERAHLVDELERLARDRAARIWVFFGSDNNVTWTLKRDLEQRLVPGDSVPLGGSCFTHLRVYTARP
jgi:mannosyltransferase